MRRVELAAYHEAGHVAVALCHRRRVHEVSVFPDAGDNEDSGSARIDPAPPVRDMPLDFDQLNRCWLFAVQDAIVDMQIAVAGPCAEKIKFGSRSQFPFGGLVDEEHFLATVIRLESVRDNIPQLRDKFAWYKPTLMHGAITETIALLKTPDVWRAVDEIAIALMFHEHLDELDIFEVVEDTFSIPGQLRLFSEY